MAKHLDITEQSASVLVSNAESTIKGKIIKIMSLLFLIFLLVTLCKAFEPNFNPQNADLDMKISMAETNNTMRSSSHWKSFYSFGDKLKRFPCLLRREIWKVGKDDPRRIVHSLKVGLALALVSLLYLMEPLFKGIGKNAMWAVMTGFCHGVHCRYVILFSVTLLLLSIFLFSCHCKVIYTYQYN